MPSFDSEDQNQRILLGGVLSTVRGPIRADEASGKSPGSVPKRPVRPSLAWDGTDAKFETFGRDGRLVAVRPDLCPGRTAGPYRCLSLCFIFEFHEH